MSVSFAPCEEVRDPDIWRGWEFPIAFTAGFVIFVLETGFSFEAALVACDFERVNFEDTFGGLRVLVMSTRILRGVDSK